MLFAHLSIRSVAFAALVAGGFSCAHLPEPDTHVHASVPMLSMGSPVIIQGQVKDAISGAPVPHAVIYLVDLRPENWEDIQSHCARLGTANREGRIDLSATWSTKDEIDVDVSPVFQFDWVRDVTSLKHAAEVRCRAGNPVNVAVVVEGEGCYGRYFLMDTNQVATGTGARILALGDILLEPLPEGYWCYPDLKPAAFDPTIAAEVSAGVAP